MRIGDAGSVTNLMSWKDTQESSGKSGSANIGKPGCACGSRPDENNALHVAGAIVLIGALAVGAGFLNARISVGK